MAYPSWLPQTDKWLKKYQEALDNQYGEKDIEVAFKPEIKKKFDEALGAGYNPAAIAVEWQIDPAHYGHPPKSEAFSEEPPPPEAPEQAAPPTIPELPKEMRMLPVVEEKLDFHLGEEFKKEKAPELTKLGLKEVEKPGKPEPAMGEKAPELTRLGLKEIEAEEPQTPPLVPRGPGLTPDEELVNRIADLRDEHAENAIHRTIRKEFDRYMDEGIRPERAQRLIENSLENYAKKAQLEADKEVTQEVLSEGMAVEQAKASAGKIAAAATLGATKRAIPTLSPLDALILTTPEEIKGSEESFYGNNKKLITAKKYTEAAMTGAAGFIPVSGLGKLVGIGKTLAGNVVRQGAFGAGYSVLGQLADPDRKLDVTEALTSAALFGTLPAVQYLPGIGQKAIMESTTRAAARAKAIGQTLSVGGLAAATDYINAILKEDKTPNLDEVVTNSVTLMLFHLPSLRKAFTTTTAEFKRAAAVRAANAGRMDEFYNLGSQAIEEEMKNVQTGIDKLKKEKVGDFTELDALNRKMDNLDTALGFMKAKGEKAPAPGPGIEAPVPEPQKAIAGTPTRPALPAPGEAPPQKPRVDPNILDPAIVLRRMQEAEADPAQKEALEVSIASLHNENLPDVLTTSGGQIVRKKLDKAEIPYTRVRIDVTNLTETNNRLGHTEADKYLRALVNDIFARRMKENGGVADRPGADEFGAYLPYHNEAEASAITKGIEDEIAAIVDKTELKEFTNPKRAGLKTGAMYINWGVQEKIPGHPGETERLADQKALLHYKGKLDKLAEAAGMEWNSEAKNYVQKKAIPMGPPPDFAFTDPLTTWPANELAEAKAAITADEARELIKRFEAGLSRLMLTPSEIADVKAFTEEPVKGAELKHQVFRLAEEIGRDLDPANPTEAGRKYLSEQLGQVREQYTKPWAMKSTEFTRLDKRLKDKGPMFFRPWGETEKGKQLADAWKKERDEALASVTTQERLTATYAWKDKWAHRLIVEKAVKAGKPVPADVLAEYQDLYEAHPVSKEIAKAAARKTISGVHVDLQKSAGTENQVQDINLKLVTSPLAADMGELPFTATADRPALRAFINPEPKPGAKIFVINQAKLGDPKKGLERHIVMLGYDDPGPAVQAFTRSFPANRNPFRGIYEFPNPRALQNWAVSGRRDLTLEPGGYDPVRRPDYIPPAPVVFRITAADLRAGGYPIENDPAYIKIRKEQIADYKRRRDDVLAWEKSKGEPDELNRIMFQSGRPLINVIDDELVRKALDKIRAFARSEYGAQTNQKIMVLAPEVYDLARKEWLVDLQKWEINDIVLDVIRRTDPLAIQRFGDIRAHVADADLTKWAKRFFDMRPGEELEPSLKIYDRTNNKYRSVGIDTDVPGKINMYLSGTEELEGVKAYGAEEGLDVLVSNALNFYFSGEYKNRPRLNDYMAVQAERWGKDKAAQEKALAEEEEFRRKQEEAEAPIEGTQAKDAERDQQTGLSSNLPTKEEISRTSEEEVEENRLMDEAERRGEDGFDIPPPPDEMGEGPLPQDGDTPFSLADKILPPRSPITRPIVMQVFDSGLIRRLGLRHVPTRMKIIVSPGIPGYKIPENAEAAFIPQAVGKSILWFNSRINPERIFYLIGHEFGHFGIQPILDDNPSMKLVGTHLFMNEWRHFAENGKKELASIKKRYGERYQQSRAYKVFKERTDPFRTYAASYREWQADGGTNYANYKLFDEWLAHHTGLHLDGMARTSLGKRIWNLLVALFKKLMAKVGEKMGPGWAMPRGRKAYIEDLIKDCLKIYKRNRGRADKILDEKHLKSLYDEPIMEGARYARRRPTEEVWSAIPVYHGSKKRFTELQTGMGERAGGAIYFHADEGLASQYGPNIIEAKINVKNTFDYHKREHQKLLQEALKKESDYEAWWTKEATAGDWEMLEKPAVIEMIQAQGFDSYLVNDHPGDAIAVFNDDNIVQQEKVRYSLAPKKKATGDEAKLRKMLNQIEDGESNETAEDVINFVEASDIDLPADLRKAIADYRAEAAEDRAEFGLRGESTERAQEVYEKILNTYLAEPAPAPKAATKKGPVLDDLLTQYIDTGELTIPQFATGLARMGKKYPKLAKQARGILDLIAGEAGKSAIEAAGRKLEQAAVEEAKSEAKAMKRAAYEAELATQEAAPSAKKYEGLVFKSLQEEIGTYIRNASATQDQYEKKIEKLEANYNSEKRNKLIAQLGYEVKSMEGALARLEEEGYSGNPEYAIMQQAVKYHRKRMDALYERLARIPPAIKQDAKTELVPAEPKNIAVTEGFKPNHVYIQVRNTAGKQTGIIDQPYDGSKTSLKEAVKEIQKKINFLDLDQYSMIQSRIGATDENGEPAWVISPNLQHIDRVGTEEANLTLGIFPEKPLPAERPQLDLFGEPVEAPEKVAIEKFKREKAEKEKALDRGVEGLPLFDKNVQEEGRSEQLRLFSLKPSDQPPTDAEFDLMRQAAQGAQPESKDLIAMHNTNGDGIAFMDELGGIPAPSLGIANFRYPFSSFGDITLIFDKNSIDPSIAKVFDSDVYSPRTPEVLWDSDMKAYRALDKEVREKVHAFTKHYSYLSTPEDHVKHGNKERFIDSLMAEKDFVAWATMKQGKEVPWKNFIAAPNLNTELSATKSMKAFIAANPEFLNKPEDQYTDQDAETWKQALLAAADEYALKTKKGLSRLPEEERQDIIDGHKKAELRKYVEDFKDFKPIMHRNYEFFQDAKKLAEGKIHNDRLFRDWAEAQVKADKTDGSLRRIAEAEANKVFGERYIESGRQTLPVTLDNLVDVMLASGVRGVEAGMTFGPGKARAFGARQLKSMERIQQEKGRLVSSEEMDKAKKELEGLTEQVQKTAKTSYVGSDLKGFGGTWDFLDNFHKVIADYFRGAKNTTSMERALWKNGWKDPPTHLVQEMIDLAEHMRNMPTEYFEAKLERPVPLAEIKAAIVSKKEDLKTIAILEKHGIPVFKYDGYKEGDRENWVKKASKALELRFSLAPDASAGIEEDFNIPEPPGLPADPEHPERMKWEHEQLRPRAATILDQQGYYHAKDGSWLISRPNRSERDLLAKGRGWRRTTFNEAGKPSGHDYMDTAEAQDYIVADLQKPGPAFSLDPAQLWALPHYQEHNLSTAGATSPEEARDAAAAWKTMGPKSPWFKRWFGDWEKDKKNASKIVDDKGRPRVVYHGSVAPEDFAVFNVGEPVYSDDPEVFARTGSGADPTAYLGSHFAFEPSVASAFADGLYGERVGAAGGKVYPVYLNIRNPKIYKAERELFNEIAETEIDAEQFGGLADALEEEQYGKDKDMTRKVNKRLIHESNSWEDNGQSLGIELAGAFKKKLLAEGYDGIIYENAVEGGTSVVGFEPNQIKSSIGNLGTFRPYADNIKFALANTEDFDIPELPGGPLPADFFYSNAENAVKGISMNRAPAGQWWNMLKPEGGRGTKKEELDWLGLETWLKDRGGAPVTKKEILDFIDENKIIIKQRPLMDQALSPQDEAIVKKLTDKHHEERVNGHIQALIEQGKDEDEIDRVEVSNFMDWGSTYDNELDHWKEQLTPEYDDYQLGGPKDNYRETLYQLHFKKMLPEGYELVFKGEEGAGYKLILSSTGETLGEYTYITAINEARDREGLPPLYLPPHYQSLNYESLANAVGHTRTNERAFDDGTAFLFGEEFQSDMHEQGHKLGYLRTLDKVMNQEIRDLGDKKWNLRENLRARGFVKFNDYSVENTHDRINISMEIQEPGQSLTTQLRASIYVGPEEDLDPDTESNTFEPVMDRIDEASLWQSFPESRRAENKALVREYFEKTIELYKLNWADQEKSRGVIDMPYKSSWMKLLAKAFIEQAIEGGHQGAGFTTGEQQFQRWGSELIGWKKNPDGTWRTYYAQQYRGMAGGIDLEAEARRHGLSKTGDEKVSKREHIRNIVEIVMRDKKPEYSPANYEKYLEKWTDTIWNRMQTEPEGNVLPRRIGLISSYDEQLVNEFNLLLKPYGVKVEKRLMDVGKREMVRVYEGPDVTLEMMKDIAEAEGDGPNTTFYNFVKKQMEHRGLSFREVMEAGTGQIGAAGRNLLNLVNGKMVKANLAPAEHIWYFPIPADLAQAVRKRGLPMFSLSGDEIGRMGSQPSKPKDWSPAEREAFYQDNARLQKKFKGEALKKAIKETAIGAKEGLEKTLVSISMQLENINPQLKYRMRKFVQLKLESRNNARKLVLPFLKKKAAMTPEDREKYDLAEKNIDEPTIEALNAKYDLGIEYKMKRLALERIYDEAQKAGFEDLGYIFRYAPRSPSDLDGFMQFLYGPEGSVLKEAVDNKVKDRFAAIDKQIEAATARYDAWLKEVQDKGAVEINELRARYMEALAESAKAEAQTSLAGVEPGVREKAKAREAEIAERIHIKERNLSARLEEINNEKGARLQDLQSKKKPLSKEETFKIANNLLRGFEVGKTRLPAPGFTKARSVEIISPELNKYYDHSDIALLKYIDGMTEAIEIRKLFGKYAVVKDKQLDIPESVGQISANLVEQGLLKQEQEEKLRYLLNAYFNPERLWTPLALYRNLEYIETLGNIFSAITQIQDQAFAIGNAGWVNWAVAVAQKNRIDVRLDYGIENICHEFSEASKTTKALELALKYGGLSIMDRLGKNVLVNATYLRYQKDAANPKRRTLLMKELVSIFGKERAPLVLDDLRRQELTEEVRFLLFNTLFDFQPVDPLELPPGYSTGGKARVLYMLKTYTLKQWERFAAQILKGLKAESKEERIEAFRLLVMFMGGIYALGIGVDTLKDLLAGRKIRLADTAVDNIFKLFGFSKFQVMQFRVEKPQWAIAKLIAPPFRFFESVWTDTKQTYQKIKKGEEVRPSKWQIWQSVPLLGKLYYGWIGGGVEKQETRIIKEDLGSVKKAHSIAGRAAVSDATPEQMLIWEKYYGKKKGPIGAGLVTQLENAKAEYTRLAVEADENTRMSIERAKDNLDEMIRKRKLDLVKEWEAAEPPSRAAAAVKEAAGKVINKFTIRRKKDEAGK